MVSSASTRPPNRVTPKVINRERRRPSEDCGQLFFHAAQAALIDGGDAVGDLQHGGAARHQLVVEEAVAEAVAFFGRPGQHAVEDLPSRLRFPIAAPGKGCAFFGCERLRIGQQRGLGFALEPGQASALRGGARFVRRQQEIADVGSRQIDLRANLVEARRGVPGMPCGGASPRCGRGPARPACPWPPRSGTGSGRRSPQKARARTVCGVLWPRCLSNSSLTRLRPIDSVVKPARPLEILSGQDGLGTLETAIKSNGGSFCYEEFL